MGSDFSEAAEKLIAMWAEKSPRSQEMFARASKVIPSGVTHDMRSRMCFSPYFSEADGAWKNDIDGNRYLDMWIGHGSLIMGHNFAPVVEVIKQQASRGTHLGGCHPAEVELAEQIKEMSPGCDRVRFVMSGTEATMLAIRLARAATGRNGVIKFHSHFHGWHDAVSAGRSLPYDVPLGGGLTSGITDDIAVLPTGDIDQIDHLLSCYGGIAAIILEPTGAHGGQEMLSPEFVKKLREVTTRHGTLLIFDEIITGFRVAQGGAQQMLGIQADLVTYAKVAFGGLPGGAVCGREDIMKLLEFSDNEIRNRYSKVHHNGTHNANPMSARVGTTVLKEISQTDVCQKVAASGDKLIVSANKVFEKHSLGWIVYGGNSVIHVKCGLDEKTFADCKAGNWSAHSHELLAPEPAVRKLLDIALLINGVDLPTGGQAWLSVAHGDDEIEYFSQALDKALLLLKETGAI